MRWIPVAIVLGLVLVFTLFSSLFIVDERRQALVLQFGQVVRVQSEPGPGFKVPFIQDVAFYEDRILPVQTTDLEITALDNRRLIVDAFGRWRIADVVQFRQAAQTELAALARLERILNASVREVLGSVPFDRIVSAERTALTARIAERARESARALGVEVIDVRIRRADLPNENLEATYRRMIAEREREAADERARGKEAAQRVRAGADRQAIELVSAAEREGNIIRGRADAERNAIFAGAFGQDQEFFAFFRSLAAYEKALNGENSTLVISPDSEFFNYFKDPAGSGFGSGGASRLFPGVPGQGEGAQEVPDGSADAAPASGTGEEPSGSGAESERSAAPAAEDEPALAAEPAPGVPATAATGVQ